MAFPPSDLRRDAAVAQAANAFDGARENVARCEDRCEEARRLPLRTDARGRPGGDQIAGMSGRIAESSAIRRDTPSAQATRHAHIWLHGGQWSSRWTVDRLRSPKSVGASARR